MHSPLPNTPPRLNTPVFSDEDLLECYNGPSPIFQSNKDVPVLSDTEFRELLFEPLDPKIASAAQACKSRDVRGAISRIEELLQEGMSAETLQCCLLGAVESKTYGLVEMLLRAGVPINGIVIKPAIQQDSLSILSLFIEHGWDINQEEEWCTPPWLSLAVTKNPTHSIVSWFLKNGADPNKACQISVTPLSTAVGQAPLAIVQELLQSCRDTTTFHGQLLHFAARRTDDEASAVLHQVLDACRPNVNALMFGDCPLGYGCYRVTGLGTALHEVAREGRLELAEILLQHGTDLSIRDSCGNTALEVAEIAENGPVLDFLRHKEAKQLNV